MSDDTRPLRERLAGPPEGARQYVREAYVVLDPVLRDAKREIETLRGMLHWWRQNGCPQCGGDCAGANPPVLNCIMVETQRVLLGPN